MMVGAAASAVTGGASVSGGETVVTGDSSASVQVTNTINSDNAGGTSHTIIEKTVNGVTTREEETKDFAPGEPVVVDVSAEARAGGSSTSQTDATSQTQEEHTTAESAEASSTEPESPSAVQGFSAYVIEAISSFFASVWSLWSR